MLAKLKTFSLLGIEAVPVEVEVDVSPAGLPKTVLVGLPEAAVKESTHRVEVRYGSSWMKTFIEPWHLPCARLESMHSRQQRPDQRG